MKMLRILAAAGLLLAWSAPAFAHVTVQPREAPPGSFFRFVVRVPNERPDASTTKIEVRFPPTLLSVGFKDVEGWKRTVEMETLPEPVELFGNEITEVVGTVTWEGGEIEPHEFEEFGFSARVPEELGTLEFPAIQTYDSGEVVEWTGPADAEAPAGRVNVIDFGAGEGEGELAVLADLRSQVAALRKPEEKGKGMDMGVLLGGAGAVLGAIALALAVSGRKGRAS